MSVRPLSARSPVLLLVVVLAAIAIPVKTKSTPTPGDPTLAVVEWNAIRKVISDQRTALKAGDATKAFQHAAPGIRAQFGTSENFLSMVRASYDALLTARYAEFLEGAVIEGKVIQPLRLIASDNTVQVALYTMEKQRDGRWKIAGCILAPSTVQAA